MQKTFTYTLNASQEREFFKYLSSIGNNSENPNPYVKWALRGSDWIALMYTSGKLVVQSSDVNFGKNLESAISSNGKFEPHIGSDEVGKGDYFGPLVVCACYVDEKVLKKVRDLGIMDSKKLTDQKMLEMGKELVKLLDYEVKIVSPREYAKLNDKYKNVSIMLAKVHVEIIKRLFDRVGYGVNFVVVDQFSKSKSRLESEFNIKVPLKQYHHAENDVAVAAASIIARYFFLLEFEKMNKEYSTKFPFGCTHVIKFGKDFYRKYGMDALKDTAKVSFRTTKEIVNSS